MSLKPRTVNFEEHWQQIHRTMEAILSFNVIDKNKWNNCFSDIYMLCVAYPESFADRLYDEIKDFLTEYVEELKDFILPKTEKYLLFDYYVAWTKYNEGLKHIQTLFVYLNQQHIKKEIERVYYAEYDIDRKCEIGELGLRTWRKIMLDPLIQPLTNSIIACLEQDRVTPNVWDKYTEPLVIRGCLASFVTIDQYGSKFYSEFFETLYLDLSAKYFLEEANKLLPNCDIITYMNNVRKKLCDESERAGKYLDPSSEAKVTQKIMHNMIEIHLDYIHDECTKMIKAHEIDKLKDIYPLLKRVPYDGLLKLFCEYVKDAGLSIITKCLANAENVHMEFVDNILRLHEKYSNTIMNVFDGDTDFHRMLDKSLNVLINYRENPKTLCKSPDYLAKYCDTLIKKSSNRLDERTIDKKLDGAIIIFRYLDDKDYFLKFYSRLLAKRLIYEQSHMGSEELMITKLKNVCGFEFVNKLHRMYTDMCLSTDLNHKFSLFLMAKKYYLNVNFQVHVLQTGAWPLARIFNNTFCVPDLARCVHTFERFYYNNYNGRKLTWLFNVSIAECKLGYCNRPYTVALSTSHLTILTQFEITDELVVGEIMNRITMPLEQFQRHVSGLLDCQLLLRNGTGEINEETLLKLNLNFSHKRTKLRITPITQKIASPTEMERAEAATVERDRKLYLQAAIVRIMKSRKQLHHNELIREVLSQSKTQFTPCIHLIKSSIEFLIEKAYLNRDANDSECYNYNA